ncbi:MAG: FixG Ig-like domain-containing protein, partial [Propionibacteriaceae bacterium]|nr:FixG Ig-like domain-containing protein [Propionibacteriaceae bacterium]
MHQRVRHSRLLVILTALVTALTLVMPVGMARAATATVTAVAGQVLHRGSNTVTFNVANTAGSEATYTATVTGPSTLTIGAVAPITVAGEATEQFSVDVTVPHGTDPMNVTLTAKVVAGADTSTGTAVLPVKLKAGQNRTQGITGLTAINTIPSQVPTGGIDKAFDWVESTMFHSPWDGSYGAPNNIDIDLGDT